MDDNIWEYPFGELDDDEDMFYRKPEPESSTGIQTSILLTQIITHGQKSG